MSEELGADTWYTAILDGETFRGKAVQYTDVDGWAMFEGDICLGRTEDVRAATEARQADGGNVALGVIITGQRYRWPGGVVPYEIDPAMPNQNRVTDAIAHWQASTVIRFTQRTPQNAGQFPNYVRFFQGDGCWSEVGMQGNGQSREDRDSLVRIVWANIDPTKTHNFDQHVTDGDDVGAYDYGSIMHYKRDAFSINHQDTIVPLRPGVAIGQRAGLSEGDKAAVAHMYGKPVNFKKIVDEPVRNFKKVIDDQQRITPIKKLLDDPPRIPIPGLPGPEPVSPGANPFLLATPHHAAVANASAELSQIDGLVAVAQAKLAALQSAVDGAATELAALLQARTQALGG